MEYAINRSLSFWRCYDYMFGSFHERIFTALYLTPEYAKMSAVQMCFLLNVSESSLYRYSKNYLNSVEFMLRETESSSIKRIREMGQSV